MTFTRRILFSLAVPAFVVLSFAAAGMAGRQGIDRGLASFFEHDDALAEAAVEMYAQGLQMELALRNIVLNPGQGTAYKNFEAAGQAFATALEQAAAAADDEGERQAVEHVRALRTELAAKQQAVISQAKADTAQAIEQINKAETPAWRDLRLPLLDLKKATAASKATARHEAEQKIRLAALMAVAAALACAVGCGYNAWALKRRIERELGAEPDAARHALACVESGDLHMEVPVRPGDDASLMAAIARMQGSLRMLVGQMSTISGTIGAAAGDIASGNLDLSTRTERQASSLQQTAASLEEITSTVQLNAESAEQATRLAGHAHLVAVQGGDAVQAVVRTMTAISGQSQRIADITAVIDSLAFQTNILALNASVESARAGEHGRGFAVVASEVRALAQRCAQAAREIKGLVGENVAQVESGVQQVEDAGKTMREIVDQVSRVSSLISEIATATREQNDGLQQINQAVTQLDDVTQQNAAMVEQSSAASASLHQQASRLTELSGVFKV